MTFGADIVLHSATKFVAGHSDVVLGALVCADEATWQILELCRKQTGSVPGPMDTWLALRGLRTLHLRLERASANAAALAPCGWQGIRPACASDTRACRMTLVMLSRAPRCAGTGQ